MIYDPKKHHRRSIRLKGYDYSKPGMYYVTIVTHNHKCFFGKIENGKMILNEYGEIAQQCWTEITRRFPNIEIDEYIIMPDHIHAIIKITNPPVGTTLAVVPDKTDGAVVPDKIINNFGTYTDTNITDTKPPSLGDIVGAYKSIVSNKCLLVFKQKNQYMGKLWQRNYYEHIIKNNTRLSRIRKYIINNPANWNNYDEFFL